MATIVKTPIYYSGNTSIRARVIFPNGKSTTLEDVGNLSDAEIEAKALAALNEPASWDSYSTLIAEHTQLKAELSTVQKQVTTLSAKVAELELATKEVPK